jgi:hypothetical protein
MCNDSLVFEYLAEQYINAKKKGGAPQTTQQIGGLLWFEKLTIRKERCLTIRKMKKQSQTWPNRHSKSKRLKREEQGERRASVSSKLALCCHPPSWQEDCVVSKRR